MPLFTQEPSIQMPNIKEVALGNIIPRDAICMTMDICISIHIQQEAINRLLKIFVKKVIACINDNIACLKFYYIKC